MVATRRQQRDKKDLEKNREEDWERDELDLETEEDGARHRNDLEAGSSSSESDDQESSESEDEEEIQDQDGQNDEGDEQDEQEATEAPPPVIVKTPQQRKRRVAEAVQHFEDENELMNAVLSDSVSTQITATNWVDRYKYDRSEATAEVLTFLLQACGVSGRNVDAEEVEHSSADDIKQNVDKIAQEKGLIDIFHGRSAAVRLAKMNYRDLWDKIIRESANAGELQDGFFLEHVINLAIALSTSVVRDFRKVATTTVAQISCSLLAISAQLISTRNQADAQAKAEESKHGKAARDKASLGRANAYQRQVEAATKQIKDIMDEIDSIFQSVFTSRFRDVDPEIRLTVVEGIGRWMQLVPSTFMTSTYLKYIAWALSDRDAAVRKIALTCLIALYDVPENTNQLKDFSERFQERFRELVDDINDSVAVAGVKLLTQLIRLGHLEPSVSGQVFALMSCSSLELRAAAGELIAGMLDEYGREALEKTSFTGKKRKKIAGQIAKSTKGKGEAGNDDSTSGRTADELILAGLLYILRILAAQETEALRVLNSENHDDDIDPSDAVPSRDTPAVQETTIARVVTSLMDRISVLHNWQLMTEWLKEDIAADLFGPYSAVDLARCLLISLRELGEGSSHKIRSNMTKRKAAASKENLRQMATTVLSKEIQGLVRKYQAEADMVAPIVGLIRHMKLEVYSLRRQEKALTSLLESVKGVFFAHSDPIVCRACVEVLSVCSAHGPDTSRDAARSSLNAAVNNVEKELQSAVDAMRTLPSKSLENGVRKFRETNWEEEATEFFTLRGCLNRAVALMELEPEYLVDIPSIRESADAVLSVMASTGNVTWPIVFGAGRILLLFLIWDLRNMVVDESITEVNAEEFASIEESQIRYSEQLERCAVAANIQQDDGCKQMVALLQTDLMTLFSSSTLPDHLRRLAYVPTDEVIETYYESMEQAILEPLQESDPNVHPNRSHVVTRIIGEELPSPAESLARVCASLSFPMCYVLSSRLLSFWGTDTGTEHLNDVVKDLVRILKKKAKEKLPEIFLMALQASFLRCQGDPGAADETEEYDPIAPFLTLSEKIVASQTAFTSGASALMLYIAVEGVRWAVEDISGSRAEFLQGICYFGMRLKGSVALRALSMIEEIASQAGIQIKSSNDSSETDPWLLLYLYYEKLKEQTSKSVRPKSTMKKPRNDKANFEKAKSQSQARMETVNGRRISFALADDSHVPHPKDRQVPTSDRQTSSVNQTRRSRDDQYRTSRFAREIVADGSHDQQEYDVDDGFEEELPVDGDLPLVSEIVED